jgi:hypothetical protein
VTANTSRNLPAYPADGGSSNFSAVLGGVTLQKPQYKNHSFQKFFVHHATAKAIFN